MKYPEQKAYDGIIAYRIKQQQINFNLRGQVCEMWVASNKTLSPEYMARKVGRSSTWVKITLSMYKGDSKYKDKTAKPIK